LDLHSLSIPNRFACQSNLLFIMKSVLAFLLVTFLASAEPITNSIGMKLKPISPQSFMVGQCRQFDAKHRSQHDDDAVTEVS